MQCLVGDHKHFIVIIIFYISKNNNYNVQVRFDSNILFWQQHMQFLTVFLQNSCKRSIFTRTTQVQFKLSQTNSDWFSFISFFDFLFHAMIELQLKVHFFSGLVQTQSGFFPVLWTGLLNPINIVAREAYLQGLHRSSSNQVEPIQTSSVSLVFTVFFIFMEQSNCN